MMGNLVTVVPRGIHKKYGAKEFIEDKVPEINAKYSQTITFTNGSSITPAVGGLRGNRITSGSIASNHFYGDSIAVDKELLRYIDVYKNIARANYDEENENPTYLFKIRKLPIENLDANTARLKHLYVNNIIAKKVMKHSKAEGFNEYVEALYELSDLLEARSNAN